MALMTPDPFASERSAQLAPQDVLRRLRWRARRGLLENDLLLERFFQRWEGRLTVADHDGLGLLLDLTDNDLLDLLVGNASLEGHLDQPHVHDVLSKIRADSP
jgi:antitoxin CptB